MDLIVGFTHVLFEMNVVCLDACVDLIVGFTHVLLDDLHCYNILLPFGLVLFTGSLSSWSILAFCFLILGTRSFPSWCFLMLGTRSFPSCCVETFALL